VQLGEARVFAVLAPHPRPGADDSKMILPGGLPNFDCEEPILTSAPREHETISRPKAVRPADTLEVKDPHAYEGCPIDPSGDLPGRGPSNGRGNSLNLPVHRGAPDAEQLSQFRDRVLTRLMEIEEMRRLTTRQLWLLAFQSPLRLGDSHSLTGAGTDEVGLKLSNHGQHVQQQLTDGIIRAMGRTTYRQCNTLARRHCNTGAREFVNYVSGVQD